MKCLTETKELETIKTVAALFGCGYGFFDFSLEKKIRK